MLQYRSLLLKQGSYMMNLTFNDLPSFYFDCFAIFHVSFKIIFVLMHILKGKNYKIRKNINKKKY